MGIEWESGCFRRLGRFSIRSVRRIPKPAPENNGEGKMNLENTNGVGPQLIDLRRLVKNYKTGGGEVRVLKEINLAIGPGEFVSVMGPSGSGKSTLINMITGIDRPTGGEVLVEGQPVHAMTEDQLARWRGRSIGVIFQFFQLIPTLTILENIILPMDFCGKFPGRERTGRAMKLLERVGIPEQADKLPSALSGGQQQRAAIARALANDPPLLVGDEPTGNLDRHTAAGMFGLFESLRGEGKTVLIVTHDRELSQRTRRVINLLDGEIEKDYANGKAVLA
jgi:putative ABC transport system ATP-binding protein